jgi:peptidoglycan/xylan/chitin deacetylase (PgdA/CDA1 family)
VDLISPWRRGFAFTAADGLPVLLYHKVGRYPAGAPVKSHYVSPALFRAQMLFLHRAGYRAVGSAQVMRYAQGETLAVERPLAITFDDGYDCVYQHALPVLAEFGFTAIVFMLAASVGSVNDWEANLVTPEPMLTAEHLAELSRAGIEIGSHGMTHQHLARLAPAELRAALDGSKEKLEHLVGREVTALAYPYGEHSPGVRAAAAAAGYRSGFAAERGVVRAGCDPFSLRRINIRRYSFLPLFARKLRLAYLIPPPVDA